MRSFRLAKVQIDFGGWSYDCGWQQDRGYRHEKSVWRAVTGNRRVEERLKRTQSKNLPEGCTIYASTDLSLGHTGVPSCVCALI